MLIHNTYINVPIAHILVHPNSLYDLHKPRYTFSLKIIKISDAITKNSNISKTKALSTLETSFA